jgi:pyruvate dehydrogenase E1 component alpha subunit
MSDHTTADDASRYRTKEEVEAWKAKDPILRLERYMEKKGLWTPVYQKEAAARAMAAADEAVKQAESLDRPDPHDMFNYTYGSLTQRQKKEMKDF